MEKITLKLFTAMCMMLMINSIHAQVGIGTPSPDAQLDIRSSNQAAPANNDGILIPKMDVFPATNPTAAQQSMLVYITAATTFGGNPKAPGFYYWDNGTTDWIGISSAANGDHDWYEEGAITAPNDITDDMFHTGNVAIGKNTTNYPLEINGVNLNRTLNITTTNNVSDGTFNASFLNDYTGNSDDNVYVSRNTFSGTSLGNVIGNSVQLNSSGTNPFFGSYNVIGNSSAGSHIAIQNSLGLSTNNNFGVRNLMQNSASGGSYNGVSNELYNNTGNGTTIGVNNFLGTSGTNPVFGSSTSISDSGTGAQIGNYATISNTGNGIHYGVQNILSGTGTGIHYGNHNTLNGIGTGAQYGNYSIITNTGTGIHYGTFNTLSGSGIGQKYGVRNELNGQGNQTGNYNILIGTGTGLQIGTYNEITTTNPSAHTGVLSTLSGTGVGLKTGMYSYINPTAGGTHYGIYSEVLKAGATNFAGYFLGNVGIGTTAGNRYIFPASRGTVGQTMRTDATGNVTWANNSDFAWSLTGNSTAAANFIGTTNAQAFRFYSNNIERMRINPTDGEVVVGAAASPYAGDALSAVATPTLPFAVNGYSAQNGSGVWGEVLAASTTAFSAIQGIYGGTGVGSGVLGNYNGTNTSNTRSGIFGVCSTPAATNGGAGVVGYNSIASGNQHMGVLGYYNGASFGIGVHGIGFGGGIMTGNVDAAVVGWRANNANYSGYFNGNHVIANGTKTASVGTSKGNQLLYVTELPEVWFEDVGGGQLVNGIIHVELDSMFLETIFIDDKHPMRVFLQEEGESNGLIVIKDADNKGFSVKEKNGGTSNISFSFRIMAKRLHFQNHRFGNDPLWGEGDTRKYNQYATPPPVDYQKNVRFQEEQKKNYKPTPMPEGFINYFQLQEEVKKMETEKTKKAEKHVDPAKSLQPNEAKN